MTEETVIHQLAYSIWPREGCPEGKALDHWLRAKAELAGKYGARFAALTDCGQRSEPRPQISMPPAVSEAGHVPTHRDAAAA